MSNKIIDLTSPAKALEYLKNLPQDQTVSLPATNEPYDNIAHAVSVALEISAAEYAIWLNRWDWTVGELVREAEIINELECLFKIFGEKFV